MPVAEDSPSLLLSPVGATCVQGPPFMVSHPSKHVAPTELRFQKSSYLFRRLPEKNIPDYGGFLGIFAARKWEHSPAM